MATVPQILPGLTVTDQPTWDRVMAAFGTVANYKAWQRGAIRDEVRNREISALQATNEQAMYAKVAEFTTFLDPSTAT